MWSIKSFSVQGQQHSGNDDVIFRTTTEDTVCVTLCDGASCAKFGNIGARIAAKAVIRKLSNHSLLEKYIQNTLSILIAREISELLDKEFEKAAALYHCDPLELSCTLIAFCINRKDNTYLCIHVGDGYVLAGGQNIQIISLPSRGLRPGETDLLPSSGKYSNMRIHIGSVSDFHRFVLMTDGIDQLAQQNTLKAIVGKSFEDIENAVAGASLSDDCSVVFLEKTQT